MKEKPGVQTPWAKINQLLAYDERFEVEFSYWQGFLLAPKQSSQLAALLYFLNQSNIRFCIQGKGSTSFPSIEHAVIISTRFFSQMMWYEHGVVEVGAGCSLNLLHQFLFEKNHEVALEKNLVGSSKRSIGGLILSDQIAGLRYRQESFSETILGLELVTWEGCQVKWGGIYKSSVPGPTLHKLIWGLESLPGIVTKVILKTYPIPNKRLELTWSFRQQKELWQQLDRLKQFSLSWEYLDVVLSGQPSSQGFIFAQISGLSQEMEAFAQRCPRYAIATQQEEKRNMKQFFIQQKLTIHPVHKEYVLKQGEYLWYQEWKSKAWLLTPQSIEKKDEFPIWKRRFQESFNLMR